MTATNMELKIMKCKKASGNSFVKINWRHFSVTVTSTCHQEVLSADIIREQRDAKAENML